MTIKLILLKSGEDIIADLKEMTVGSDDDIKVIGYYLDKPCVVKMKNPTVASGKTNQKTAGYEVTLFPWMPLSKDDTIPIPADWLVTLVEPVSSLKNMYIEDIVEHGQDNQSSGTSESTDSDN
tara:strand:+ start:549 stop:917 length:369 start_codon:yes stop_codon:yes gene_type:complete